MAQKVVYNNKQSSKKRNTLIIFKQGAYKININKQTIKTKENTALEQALKDYKHL